jgi:hypothetical protein
MHAFSILPSYIGDINWERLAWSTPNNPSIDTECLVTRAWSVNMHQLFTRAVLTHCLHNGHNFIFFFCTFSYSCFFPAVLYFIIVDCKLTRQPSDGRPWWWLPPLHYVGSPRCRRATSSLLCLIKSSFYRRWKEPQDLKEVKNLDAYTSGQVRDFKYGTGFLTGG